MVYTTQIMENLRPRSSETKLLETGKSNAINKPLIFCCLFIHIYMQFFEIGMCGHIWVSQLCNNYNINLNLIVCRGFVYCRNEELEPGWVVFSSGRLLHRPSSFDAKPHQLCQVIDPFTLQVLSTCFTPFLI